MANDQDIGKIIDMIDRKIKALSQARKVLMEEFGGGRVEAPSQEHPLSGFGLFVPPEKKMTSKELISKLLEKEGPLRRKDIMLKTGIKHGTISFALNDRKLFEHEGGLWRLKGGGQKENE